MLKLDIPVDDFWIELDKGVRVLVRPLDAIVMQLAQSECRQIMGPANSNDDAVAQKARIQVRLSECLAQQAIVDWEGVFVADGVTKAEVNETTIWDFMSIWFINQAFFEKYTSSLEGLHIEGNGSGSAANGTLQAGQTTAGGATNSNSPAAKTKKAKKADAPTSSTSP